MKNHKISKIMFHMPLSTRMEICTASDTGKAFSEAIRHRSELAGKVFNLGGGEHCYTTYKEFLDRSFRIFGLGDADFPEHAFAECNFHCGIYTDGDELEKILHFRNDSIDTYFDNVRHSTSLLLRFLGQIFRPLVKRYLLNQSEPYKAYKSKNETLMSRFFFPIKNPVTVMPL